MRVPVRRTPGTNVVAPQEGFARGVQPLDLTPITQPIRQFARELEEEQKNLEKFDLNKRLLEETNALQQDYVERERAEPLGAAGFTNRVLDEYEQRHEGILKEYWEKGYSQEALDDFTLRLGSLRQSFGERAVRFQSQSMSQLGLKNQEEVTVQLSQLATSDPNAYGSAVVESDNSIDANPYITAVEKQQAKQQARSVIRQGAAKALAISDPGTVIQLLDPQGFTAPRSTAAQALPGASEGAYGILREFEGFRETPYWDVNHHRVGYGSDTITRADGTVEEVTPGMRVTREDAERDLQRRVGELEASISQRAGTGWQQIGPGAQAAVVSVAYNYGASAERLAPLYNAVAAGDPQQVASIIESFAGDNNGVNRGRRLKEAELARASAPVEGESGLGSVEVIDPGASSIPAAADPSTLVPPNEDTSVKPNIGLGQPRTGNPILDDMTGAERLQVLGWAREAQSRKTAKVEGALDVVVNNAVAAIGNGEYGGPKLTEEQFKAGYSDPVEAEQKWATYENAMQAGQAVQRFRTANPETMEREIERLRPDPSSASYAIEQKMYEAAVTARDTILKAREEDPAAYVMQAFPAIRTAAEAAETPEQRKAVYAEMMRAYDTLGVPRNERYLMTDGQVAQLTKDYKTGSPETRLGLIERMISEMGPVTAGTTLGRAGGEEAAGDLVLYNLLRGANRRNTFLEVLYGKQLIEADPARKPNPSQVNSAFRGQIKSALNNINGDISRSFSEAASALYIRRGGKVDAQQFDATLYREAFREVVGGRAGDTNTGIVDMKKGSATDLTILPPNITKQQFEGWLDGLTDRDFVRLGGRAPVDKMGRRLTAQNIIDYGVPVFVAPGRYQFKMASDGLFVKDTSGRNYTMKVDLVPPRRR